MSKIFYSEVYGRLTFISRVQYIAGAFRYVGTETDADTGDRFDIVECLDDGELYFTVI